MMTCRLRKQVSRRAALAFWAGLSLCVLTTWPVHAQSVARPAVAESLEYKATISHAVDEFAAGNYPEARGLFMRAHELYPNARTFRGIGITAFELRNYAVSVDNLQAALAGGEKPLTDEMRKSTEQLLLRARAFLARVELEVTPKSARVLVDGEPVEQRVLMLEVGNHQIDLQASGYLPERRTLNIAGGEQLKLNVALQRPDVAPALAAADAKSTPTDDSHMRPRRWYRNPWLWAGVAVVAVGAGVGVGLATRPGSTTESRPTEGTAHTPQGGVFQALRSW